jgi:toxin-antitoxin system, toxin component, bro family
MSEKMAGIFALNVINEKDYMEINGKRIERKEYNGVPVLSSWDIAEIHGKEIRRVNENFKYVREKLILNEDYFIIERDKFSETDFPIQNFIPNNVKEIPLFTETGYMLLCKTFGDDFSWQLQRFLVRNYFNMQKLMHSIQNGEIEVRKKEEPAEFEIRKLENESEMIRLEKAKLLERLANNITNEKMKNTLIIHSANTVTGQLLLEPEKAERRSYTANEISEMLKERYNIEITVNMLGRIATKYGIKTEEYGYLAYDKSKTSVKQVETFRYFENAVPKFYEIIKEHYSVKYL